MGFGHRVYTAGDPRAAILKGLAEAACRQSGQALWYDLAVALHAKVQATKRLIPNVDFYSAPLFYSIGIPVDLFTPVIAAARIAGWTANLLEQYDDNRLIRPRADYKGPPRRPFVAGGEALAVGQSLTRKLIERTWSSGKTVAGEEIGLHVDQALLTDTNGTMAFLQFEAMGFPRVRPSRVVTYIDHNVYQVDSRNSDDHRYLQTASRRYGAWFSKPGNGICHQVHFESFSVPGQFVLGTDSHTPLCGSTGMLAIGAGGLDVAVAMGGGPYHVAMPRVVARRLTGRLRPWVSAKDVIMELLRRYTVRGGSGRIFEYGGPGRGDALPAPAGHHLQHGRRADADHQRVPLGRGDARVLPAPRARGGLAAAGRGPRRGVRRADRARSLEPRAAGRPARLAGPRGAGVRGRGHARSSRSWWAPAPTPRGRTCRR